jgi:cytochrome c biogenesis protein CcmG, thiol:disulfide interchange protein DsbE
MRHLILRAFKSSCLLMLPLTLIGASATKEPKVGDPAPDAEITLMDGSKLNLSEARGDVVILNFWATWCVPCRTELPLLDTYYSIQKQHGLRVYAVTTEGGSAPLYKLKAFFGKVNITGARKIKGPYGPIKGSVPTNYIIGRDGKLRYAQAGAFSLDVLNAEIVPALKEPRPGQ